jgi:hypothetical protein
MSTTDVSNTSLLQEHKPLIFLHPDDAYRPSSIEYYLENSSGHIDGELVSNIGEITMDNILEYENNKDGIISLHIEEEHIYGMSTDINRVPLYGVVTHGTDKISIQYIMFYPYNGASQPTNLGDHYADFEHITVELDKTTQDVLRVYLSAHRGRDGLWLRPDELEYSDNGRMMVYSSENSHAFYPTADVYHRVGGLANDVTSNNGPIWDGEIIEIDDNTPWNRFGGYYGRGSIKSPYNQDWWRTETGTSTNFWKRLFSCCL